MAEKEDARDLKSLSDLTSGNSIPPPAFSIYYSSKNQKFPG
jgi:hypothetical protein